MRWPPGYKGLKVLFAGGDLDEQEPTLLTVHKLFSPLAGAENPIYRNRAIVLIDKPNPQQQTKYLQFKTGYPYLFADGQIFELTENSLEEYYPTPHRRTVAEIASLDAVRGKVGYAKQVAEAITQDQFESGMPKLFGALEACNAKAFGAAVT